MLQCAGDPFRYPATDPVYADLRMQPVAFRDSGGFRLSGRVWAPRTAEPGQRLPAVVIVPGGAQPTETMYWWAAHALVRAGYVVMTFDVRTQGRSDAVSSSRPEENLERDELAGSGQYFVPNTVEAVEFLMSTAERPYVPTEDPGSPLVGATDAFNPFGTLVDRSRIGLAGHSAGGIAISVVQGLDPWPGASGPSNPVSAVVGWDGLADDVSSQGVQYMLGDYAVVPRVPGMTQQGDYTFTGPVPHDSPPPPDSRSSGFRAWRDAGLPAVRVVVQGGTHYEWSLIPTFPSTPWGSCSRTEHGRAPGATSSRSTTRSRGSIVGSSSPARRGTRPPMHG
jgi:hypothetical protein